MRRNTGRAASAMPGEALGARGSDVEVLTQVSSRVRRFRPAAGWERPYAIVYDCVQTAPRLCSACAGQGAKESAEPGMVITADPGPVPDTLDERPLGQKAYEAIFNAIQTRRLPPGSRVR